MANEGIVLKIGNEALDQITTFKIVYFFPCFFKLKTQIIFIQS